MCCVNHAKLHHLDATRCASQSLNIPWGALSFYHAAPSTSQLYNQYFPSNGIHRQCINPCWSETGSGKNRYRNRYRTVGAGELGVARCPFSWETTYAEICKPLALSSLGCSLHGLTLRSAANQVAPQQR